LAVPDAAFDAPEALAAVQEVPQPEGSGGADLNEPFGNLFLAQVFSVTTAGAESIAATLDASTAAGRDDDLFGKQRYFPLMISFHCSDEILSSSPSILHRQLHQNPRPSAPDMKMSSPRAWEQPKETPWKAHFSID
jgi:hypothetical protein